MTKISKSKKTKRALLTSAFAILMCTAMLVGTTFAWFTDTATTAVNKIQSGTLDIDIVDENGNTLEGKSLNFKKAEGHEDEEILWEPGVTFDLNSFKIVNKGNLALKYKVTINGVDGDAKLLEAIEFTIKKGEAEPTPVENWEGVLLPDGETAEGYETIETAPITISGHMKEDAGNEYQNLSIEGIGITVAATQFTYEYDSYNNTYDANATYPITNWVEVGTFEELAAAKKAATADAPTGIKLTADIDATAIGMIQNEGNRVVIDMNGHTITLAEDNYILVKAGTLELTGEGTISSPKGTRPAVYVVGSSDPNAEDYTKLVVGKDITINADTCIAISYYNDVTQEYGVKVIVNGTLNAVNEGIKLDWEFVQATGNVPEITLSKTSKITAYGSGIAAAGYAKWNLAGDIITTSTSTTEGFATSGNALMFKSGIVNITGGTYKSTDAKNDPAEGPYSYNKNSGAAICLVSDEADNCPKKLDVTISGGTFISENSYGLLECISVSTDKGNAKDATASYTNLTITGGTFQGAAGAIKLNDMANKESVVSGGTTDSNGAYVVSATSYTVK